MNALAQLHCTEIHANEAVTHNKQLVALHHEVPDWHIFERESVTTLERVFVFYDFAEALAFTDAVGALAQEEGHHPSILTEWGKVRVTWWTHSLRGLHPNDFIMAAKTDALYRRMKPHAHILAH